MSKCFRTKDGCGPDYVCSKCNRTGLRLWRQSHTFLNQIALLCATCAEEDQVKQIAEYAKFHDPNSPGIGDLIPARPTPEGDTFWGHTSGDVGWWYRLPQYTQDTREAEVVKRERDMFIGRSEEYGDLWMKERKENRELRKQLEDACTGQGI